MSCIQWGIVAPEGSKAWFGARMNIVFTDGKYNVEFSQHRAGLYGNTESEEGKLIQRLIWGQDLSLAISTINRVLNERREEDMRGFRYEWELPLGVKAVADTKGHSEYIFFCVYK